MSSSVTGNSLIVETGRLVAGLPMYDLPHLQRHNDVFWGALAKRLVDAGLKNVPQDLTRPKASLEELWLDPNLLLAQTCGYPLTTHLKRNVQLVATPVYSADGCRGALHRSAIVVHKNNSAQTIRDLSQGRCAVNDLSSNTGMNLLRSKVAPLADGKSFFESVVITGSHALSLEFVATHQADVAAIDCITFAHLKTLSPELVAAVKIIDWTDEAPGLPLITSRSTSIENLHLLRRALVDLMNEVRLIETVSALLLEGFEFLEAHDYQRVLDIQDEAIFRHYPVLL